MRKPIPQDAIDEAKSMNDSEPRMQVERSISYASTLLDQCGIPMRFKDVELKSLIRCERNIQAFDVVDEYVQYAPEFIEQGRGLIFIGPPGSGKTALSIALLKEVARRWTRLPLREYKAKWTSAGKTEIAHREISNKDKNINRIIIPTFVSTRVYFDSLRQKMDDSKTFRSTYFLDYLQRRKSSRAPNLPHSWVTVVDDLGSEYGREWVAEQRYNLINTAYEQRLPLLITSNLTKAELENLDNARVSDRILEMCVTRAIDCDSWRAMGNKP